MTFLFYSVDVIFATYLQSSQLDEVGFPEERNLAGPTESAHGVTGPHILRIVVTRRQPHPRTVC